MLSLAALFWACSKASTPRAAFLYGFIWGTIFFLVGVSWVYVSLHTFGMMPMPLAALATLLFCLFLALFPAFAMYLQARIGIPPVLKWLCAAPSLWVLGEWIRSWIFTGFPWLTLGYAGVQSTLDGFAPIVGVYGLSLIIAIIAGAFALILQNILIRWMLALIFALIIAGSLSHTEWTQPKDAPLSVALLQGNIPQALKFQPGRYESTLATYEKLATQAQAKLIVLPEVAIPRLLSQVDPVYIERMRGYALAQGGDMLLPAPIADEKGYYNAVLSFGSAPTQSYSKTHLVPFGEFVPPGFGWIVNVLQIPMSDFGRGGVTQKPLQVAGEKVAINICYEDAFGEEIIRQLPEATLLVNVSNVAWFGDSLAPAQHLRISRMRALETGRYMLRATNTGVTAIINAEGRVVSRLPNFTEGVLRGEARGYEGATPYVRFGNWPAISGALLLLAAAMLAALRKRPFPK